MKNDQKGCGCSSQVMVAMIGLIGIILTGAFGLAGAILSREDIPLPFFSSQDDPVSPVSNPPDTSSQNTNNGSTTTIPDTPVSVSTTVRSHMVLDGFTVDNATGATASYQVELDAEGVVGSNRSTFTGVATTTIQDVFGQIYGRQASVEGEFNSGVLSFYDTGVIQEDFLPSGGFWCFMSVNAPAVDTQGSAFSGSYESVTPPCFGQVNLQVVSQTQLP